MLVYLNTDTMVPLEFAVAPGLIESLREDKNNPDRFEKYIKELHLPFSYVPYQSTVMVGENKNKVLCFSLISQDKSHIYCVMSGTPMSDFPFIVVVDNEDGSSGFVSVLKFDIDWDNVTLEKSKDEYMAPNTMNELFAHFMAMNNAEGEQLDYTYRNMKYFLFGDQNMTMQF